MNSAIIVAAGKGKRMGPDVDKVFLSLGAKPVFVYSLLAFEKCPDIDEIVLVVRKERLESARYTAQMFGCKKITKIVAGGSHRQMSVAKGLDSVDSGAQIIAVHDGARPCVTAALISETVRSAKQHGSGVAAVKITDTVKRVEIGMIVSETVDRTKLWRVQTPQAFNADLLRKAFLAVGKKKIKVTDEASAVELISENVRLVESISSNIKITSVDDLALAAALMRL